jgi:hypothetical protein
VDLDHKALSYELEIGSRRPSHDPENTFRKMPITCKFSRNFLVLPLVALKKIVENRPMPENRM